MDFIGMELHSSRMWRWASVKRVLQLMKRLEMNALIFHQNDLIDQLVYPEKYFDYDLMWKRWPVRLHTIENNRHYIKRVIDEAKSLGINFYLEVKELYYPEALLEIIPELRSTDGTVCASHPFWWEFLQAKTQELLAMLPEIAGIIVSPATRESKVSISTNTCKCERCQQTKDLDWYRRLLEAMYQPLSANGKRLILRDFSYTADQQNISIDAASLVSKDIVIALKNTPHDFYPTFPNNPRIGKTNGHLQWVEFDTWGQFFGIGFFPCSVVEDMKERIQYNIEHGVTGIWLRTDWEVLTEGSSFNSFNLLNVFAGGILAQNPDVDVDVIYQAWTDYGLLSALQSESCLKDPVSPSSPTATQKLKEFMIASWSVMKKAVYVRGHVIHEDMMFPLSMKMAFDMMVKIHGRDDWEPGASKLVEPTCENIEFILKEKREAIEEVNHLPEILQPKTLGLPRELAEELEIMLDLYKYYVLGFYYCTAVCYLTKYAQHTQEIEDVKKAEKLLEELTEYKKKLSVRLKGTTYPHYVYWLLDTKRLEKLISDIKKHLLLIQPIVEK